ncbi:preprotein translocase subunit YajC [Spirochaetota bacterium]
MFTLINTFGILLAQDKGTGGTQGSPLGSFGTLIPIVLMLVIFYFLLIRPQQKKEKERKALISSIQKGDRVLTAGGLYGTVVELKGDDSVILKIADKTKVEFTRNSIQGKVT